jgi:hypothetical protein
MATIAARDTLKHFSGSPSSSRYPLDTRRVAALAAEHDHHHAAAVLLAQPGLLAHEGGEVIVFPRPTSMSVRAEATARPTPRARKECRQRRLICNRSTTPKTMTLSFQMKPRAKEKNIVCAREG